MYEVQLFATHQSQAEGTYLNFEMLMCHTSLDSLTTVFQDNYDGNEPYSVRLDSALAIDWTAPGWNGLAFDRTFAYDGTDNLLIEFRYLGDDDRTVNAKAWYAPGGPRCLDGGYPTEPTGEFMTFMTSVRIYFEPTGTGEEPAAGLSVRPSENPCGRPSFMVEVPEPCDASLTLYDTGGRVVAGILDGWLEEGLSETGPGPELPPGVYIAVLRAGGAEASCRIAALPGIP